MNTPTKPRPFYVIAADMACHDSETMTLPYRDIVVAVADSNEDALELSRTALEDGFAPLIALDADDLHQALAALRRDLKPGEAYNLNKEMNQEEMRTLRNS